MKAAMFAVVLSFFAVSLPSQVIAQDSKSVSPVSQAQSETKKININKASAQELVGSVKGIGIKRAEAIVSYRDAHGGYKSINELSQVKGLGKMFVDNHLAQLQDVFLVE